MFYGNTYQIVGLLSRTVDKFQAAATCHGCFLEQQQGRHSHTVQLCIGFQLFKAVGERLQRRWLPAEVL